MIEYTLIFIVVIIILILIYKSSTFGSTYVRSTVDGQNYVVKDVSDKQISADLLAKLKKNIMLFCANLKMKKAGEYKEYEQYIDQLCSRINDVVIMENINEDEFTSYSVNKGEQLIFCLHSKTNGKPHELNLLMYVVLHEIAHIACPDYGHGQLFKQIFGFFVKTAIKLNIYSYINFNQEHVEYCGMTIYDSII